MKRKNSFRLGDLQLRIMKVLWERPDATVADVLAGLGPNADLAYTTIATMLRKMEERGLVQHRVEGRAFLYRAGVGEAEVSHGMTSHLVDRLFSGSLAEVVSHLLTTREVSHDELRELEKLIAAKKKQL